MKQEVTFEERKQIQLEMLEEIDAFCRKNDIRYSIAFGTLLGAVRHKGFIPWDDDVDIMMPLPDLLKFKESFKSKNIEYVDVDTDKTYEFGFSRLANRQTFNKKGLILKTYGVCIDLYIMIGLPENSTRFFEDLEKIYNLRNQYITIRNRIVRYLPVKTIPLFSMIQHKYRDFLLYHSEGYNKSKSFYVIAGPLSRKEKMTYNRDLFETIIDIQFEGKNFRAISDWNYYLKLAYGDYMQLPPEDQRVPYHGGKYYWK